MFFYVFCVSSLSRGVPAGRLWLGRGEGGGWRGVVFFFFFPPPASSSELWQIGVACFCGQRRSGRDSLDRGTRGSSNSSGQALFLEGDQALETRPRALLSVGRSGRSRRNPGSSHRSQAVRERRRRRSVLSEARSHRATLVAANHNARISFRTHCRRNRGRRCGGTRLDRQLGLHRATPPSRALRRSRSPGRVEGGSRSGAWRQLGGRAHCGSGSEGAARGSGSSRLAQNQRFARDARECEDRTALDLRRGAPRCDRIVARGGAACARLASSKWWKEERHGVFLDYNQNAKDRTTCSAYSVRPLPDARVSTPLHWHEVPDCDPAEFTVLTIPKRFAELGDPHADIDAAPGSLEKLLELAAKDEAAGLGDAPWPPHFRKMEGEAPRVSPSRAKSAAKKTATKPTRTKMPLVVVANSPNRDAALAGLERWKRKHPQVAELLAVDDVLVDSMRGRSSTWTRIRVNLRHVPEALQPSARNSRP